MATTAEGRLVEYPDLVSVMYILLIYIYILCFSTLKESDQEDEEMREEG